MTKAVKKTESREKQVATAKRRADKAFRRNLAKQLKINRKLASICAC